MRCFLIKNIYDLCLICSCDLEQLKKAVHDASDCGMSIEWEENDHITLTGYVEGFNGEMSGVKMYFPFTIDEYNKTVADIEQAADELWHICND